MVIPHPVTFTTVEEHEIHKILRSNILLIGIFNSSIKLNEENSVFFLEGFVYTSRDEIPDFSAN